MAAKPTKTIEELRASANARAKKYQERQREQGKKHLTTIVSQAVFDIIADQREKTGHTTAQIIETGLLKAYKTTNAEKTPTPILDQGNLERFTIDQILLALKTEPGTWGEKANQLNEKGIKTARGKKWTEDNLRIFVKKLKTKGV